MKIYKQKLAMVPEQVLELPSYLGEEGPIKILKFETQNNVPCIWFMTNCEACKRVCFNFFMTGEELPKKLGCSEYLGTCLLHDRIVLHAFMKILGN